MIGLDLNPPWVEGNRNTVRLISQNLIKDNHEVYVLTKGSSDQLNIEFVEGIKYHRINIGHSIHYLSGSFVFLAKLPIKLIKVIKDEKMNFSISAIPKIVYYVLFNEYIILLAWKDFIFRKYSVLWEKVESTR